MALYEATLQSRYYDQQVINRWNYLGSGSGVGISGSAALASAMGFVPTAGSFTASTIAGALQAVVSNQLTFVSLLVRALYDDPTDFYDQTFPTGVVGGTTGSDSSSPVLAYGLRTNRTRSDIDRGTKRFAGVVDAAVTAGGEIDSAVLTALQAVADYMSDVLPYTGGGSTFSFAPIVVQKFMYTTPPAKKAYRYYEDEADQLEHIMQNVIWTPYDRVRSQTSRQYGHGA